MLISKPKGFALLEALLAIGLMIIFLGGLGSLFLINLRGTSHSSQFSQSDLLVSADLAALRTIDFDDLSLTNSGHLGFSNPVWTVASGSEAGEVFTKTVRVLEVQRDGLCNIVATGGTVDPDSKFIESEVVWTDLFGREHQSIARSLATRWDNPQGSCFAPTAAASLIFHIETTLWYGGKQLRELYLENGGSIPFTISAMTFTWNNGAKIQQIFMDNSKIWSSSGPGTPTGLQSSGTRLDTVDSTLGPGDIFDMDKTQFSSAMAGTTLTLTIEFTDGSVFVSDPFVPL
jgi:hypothetical protein